MRTYEVTVTRVMDLEATFEVRAEGEVAAMTAALELMNGVVATAAVMCEFPAEGVAGGVVRAVPRDDGNFITNTQEKP